MRILLNPAAPLLGVSRQPLARSCAARCDILDELKYQLSNSDEETRPARDLVENPVALAYLIVLVGLAGGLAYLLYMDKQAGARREAAYREQREAAEMLRLQGLEDAALELDRDLKQLKKAKKAESKPKPMGLQADIIDDASGNRFVRRQVRTMRSLLTVPTVCRACIHYHCAAGACTRCMLCTSIVSDQSRSHMLELLTSAALDAGSGGAQEEAQEW